jgi:hypothetical protein
METATAGMEAVKGAETDIFASEVEADAVLIQSSKKSKKPEKEKEHTKPRQYTLGDRFGSEDEK